MRYTDYIRSMFSKSILENILLFIQISFFIISLIFFVILIYGKISHLIILLLIVILLYTIKHIIENKTEH